jgi:hypothetical protein
MDQLKHEISQEEYNMLPAPLRKVYSAKCDYHGGYALNITGCANLTELGKVFQETREKAGKEELSAHVNPWKTATFNLTDQGRILRADPALAERLKREAFV